MITDRNIDISLCPMHSDTDIFTVMQSVIQQIADRTFECQWFSNYRDTAGFKRYRMAAQLDIPDHAADQRIESDGSWIFMDITVFHALQCAFDHHIELIQIIMKLTARRIIVKQFCT